MTDAVQSCTDENKMRDLPFARAFVAFSIICYCSSFQMYTVYVCNNLLESVWPWFLTNFYSNYNLYWSGLVSATLLGRTVGPFVAALMADKYGRKLTLVISSSLLIPGAVMTSLMVAVNSYWLGFVGRTIVGAGIGLSTILPSLWITEAAAVEYRGFFGAFQNVFRAAGALAGAIVALPSVLGTNIWPVTMVITCYPVLLLLPVIVLWMPESPRHLYFQDPTDSRVATSVQFYQGIPAVDSTIRSLEQEQLRYLDVGVPSFWHLIRSRTLRKPLILNVILLGLVHCTGFMPIYTYSTTIVQSKGMSYSWAATWTILMAGFQFIGALVTPVMVEKVGRRPIIVGSFWFAFAALLVTAGIMLFFTDDDSTAATAIACMLVIFGIASTGYIGAGTVSAAEIMPQHARAKATVMSRSIGEGISLILTVAYLPLSDYINAAFILLFCAFVAFCLALYLQYYLPETKGLSFEEIFGEIEGDDPMRPVLNEMRKQTASGPPDSNYRTF